MVASRRTRLLCAPGGGVSTADVPLSIAPQLFEAIPRWYAEIGETRRRVEHPQLSQGTPLHVPRKPVRPLAPEHPLGFRIPECAYHGASLSRITSYVKRYDHLPGGNRAHGS